MAQVKTTPTSNLKTIQLTRLYLKQSLLRFPGLTSLEYPRSGNLPSQQCRPDVNEVQAQLLTQPSCTWTWTAYVPHANWAS